MIEQIEEYLRSNDKNIIMIGYELLKRSDLSPEQKSKIMDYSGIVKQFKYDTGPYWYICYIANGYSYIDPKERWLAPLEW